MNSASPKRLRVAVGRTIGRYRLVGELGRGPMGVVYHAIDDDGIEVAIKVLHRGAQSDELSVRRFRRHCEQVNQICHPGIAHILDSGALRDGRPFYVMEYLAGESLDARVGRVGRLPADQAVEIVQSVTDAVAAGHARGLPHQDIKPQNIFLADDGPGRHVVKVLDFGVAKLADADIPDSTDGILGFTAPERRLGRTVDRRSDTFSLGALLCYALTGQPPKSGAAKGAAWLAAPPSHAGAPVEFDGPILRCLDPRPSRRPRSLGEARDAFVAAFREHRATAANHNTCDDKTVPMHVRSQPCEVDTTAPTTMVVAERERARAAHPAMALAITPSVLSSHIGFQTPPPTLETVRAPERTPAGSGHVPTVRERAITLREQVARLTAPIALAARPIAHSRRAHIAIAVGAAFTLVCLSAYFLTRSAPSRAATAEPPPPQVAVDLGILSGAQDSAADVPEVPSPEAVRSAVAARAASVERCFEGSRSQSRPTMTEVVVKPSGATAVTLVGGSEALRRCVAKAVHGVRVPRSRRGLTVVNRAEARPR